VTEEERLAAEFETHRPYLHAIAFRVLGSHADADDAVQEAWLRLARTGAGGIEDLRGWLTTVTGRICLDALRRRGTRVEQPLELSIGMLAPEGGTGPEEEVLLADSVALALYVVMDALTPAERVSFVLHDVFEFPFDTIAAILCRSTAATKMLASRARGRIRLGAPATVTAADAAAREVVDAFFAAAGRGDLAGLLAVLAPDVELRAHGPEWAVVVRGAADVVAQARVARGQRADALIHPVLVDGVPGVLVTMAGRPMTVMAFTVTDGVITAIRSLTDPDRLAQAVPSWVALAAGGLDHVPEQQGCGDRSDAPGHRAQRRRRDRRVNVANQRAVRPGIGADVDDDRAGAHVGRPDQPGPADRDHHDVGLPGDRGKIPGAGVADGNGRIPVKQQVRDRSSHHNRTPHHNHPLTA
jgi:RNA polymerase sigma-70 factor (ECF subfamily)